MLISTIVVKGWSTRSHLPYECIVILWSWCSWAMRSRGGYIHEKWRVSRFLDELYSFLPDDISEIVKCVVVPMWFLHSLVRYSIVIVLTAYRHRRERRNRTNNAFCHLDCLFYCSRIGLGFNTLPAEQIWNKRTHLEIYVIYPVYLYIRVFGCKYTHYGKTYSTYLPVSLEGEPSRPTWRNMVQPCTTCWLSIVVKILTWEHRNAEPSVCHSTHTYMHYKPKKAVLYPAMLMYTPMVWFSLSALHEGASQPFSTEFSYVWWLWVYFPVRMEDLVVEGS